MLRSDGDHFQEKSRLNELFSAGREALEMVSHKMEINRGPQGTVWRRLALPTSVPSLELLHGQKALLSALTTELLSGCDHSQAEPKQHSSCVLS